VLPFPSSLSPPLFLLCFSRVPSEFVFSTFPHSSHPVSLRFLIRESAFRAFFSRRRHHHTLMCTTFYPPPPPPLHPPLTTNSYPPFQQHAQHFLALPRPCIPDESQIPLFFHPLHTFFFFTMIFSFCTEISVSGFPPALPCISRVGYLTCLVALLDCCVSFIWPPSLGPPFFCRY